MSAIAWFDSAGRTGRAAGSRASTRGIGFISTVILVSACASGPEITRLQTESDAAIPPYQRIVVVAIFESFDVRRYLERETVKALETAGTSAVAMTSLADSQVPLNRTSVVPLVERVGADAVLVVQPTSLRADVTTKDRSPQSSYNVRPTPYFNVFSVELTEYVEPPAVQYEHHLVLRSDLYSAESRQSVWAISASTEASSRLDSAADYSRFADQAVAIVDALKHDGMIND